MLKKEQWQIIADALEILNPDSDEGCKLRDEVLKLASIHAADFTARESRAVEIARESTDDNLDMDDDAETSRGDDGVWVAAWIWVPDEQCDPEQFRCKVHLAHCHGEIDDNGFYSENPDGFCEHSSDDGCPCEFPEAQA